MASTTAGRTAPLPTTVLYKLVADAWSAYLTLLDLCGDDRMAAGLSTTIMQARLMTWLEDEMTRFGLWGDEIVTVNQTVRKVS